MFKELIDLRTQIDDQLPPLGYGTFVAFWAIEVQSGEIGLIESDKKKGGKYLLPTRRHNGDFATLISDTGEYLFGWGSKKNARTHLYHQVLNRCCEETENQYAIAVKDCLAGIDPEKLWNSMIAQNKKANHKQRIIFVNEAGFVLTDDPELQAWWGDYFRASVQTQWGTCCLTGKTGEVISHTMPYKTHRVPNTQSSGASIS